MTTPYWSDFVPNSTFYRILSGFQRTFATGVACRQGTLTPPDTWSRPFGTCICFTCWDQSFSELVVILPDSSGHLVPSLWDLHMLYLLRPIVFRTCRYFTGLCSSNIPRYFLDFPWDHQNFPCLKLFRTVIFWVCYTILFGFNLFRYLKLYCGYKYTRLRIINRI